ncbi:MAG: hypothetical protein HY962_14285 [Ignavibacteriae bacterium]|nr:hypothetical protein [Ignavibacteriota bacterium]
MTEHLALTRGLTGRLVGGLASTLVYQAIAVANTILLVPLFLLAWGPDGYGHWIALTAFVTYFALLDLGGQNFIGNLLSSAFAVGDREGFRRILQEGLSLFTGISITGLLLLGALLLLPGAGVTGFTLSISDRSVLFFMGASLLISIPLGVLATVFRATGLLAQGSMLGNLLRLVFLLVSVLLLMRHATPAVYAAFQAATAVILIAAVLWYAHRRLPWIAGLQLTLSAARAGRKHLSGSLYFWLLSVAQSLKQQGVILVIGWASPAAVVALYATHRTAVGLMGYIGNIFQTPLWPEFTFMHARAERERLVRLSLFTIRFVTYVSSIAAMLLWLLLPLIYPLWTGRSLELSPTLFVVLLVQATIGAAWNTASWPLLSSNRHRAVALWSLINAGAAIVFSLAAVREHGLVGVAAAVLLADLLFAAATFPVIAARELGPSPWRFFSAMATPIVVVAAFAALLRWLCAGITSASMCLVVEVAAVLVALVPLAWLSLGAGGLSMLLRLVRTVVRRGTGADVGEEPA